MKRKVRTALSAPVFVLVAGARNNSGPAAWAYARQSGAVVRHDSKSFESATNYVVLMDGMLAILKAARGCGRVAVHTDQTILPRIIREIGAARPYFRRRAQDEKQKAQFDAARALHAALKLFEKVDIRPLDKEQRASRAVRSAEHHYRKARFEALRLADVRHKEAIRMEKADERAREEQAAIKHRLYPPVKMDPAKFRYGRRTIDEILRRPHPAKLSNK